MLDTDDRHIYIKVKFIKEKPQNKDNINLAIKKDSTMNDGARKLGHKKLLLASLPAASKSWMLIGVGVHTKTLRNKKTHDKQHLIHTKGARALTHNKSAAKQRGSLFDEILVLISRSNLAWLMIDARAAANTLFSVCMFTFAVVSCFDSLEDVCECVRSIINIIKKKTEFILCKETVYYLLKNRKEKPECFRYTQCGAAACIDFFA